jgi:hypothetical protein
MHKHIFEMVQVQTSNDVNMLQSLSKATDHCESCVQTPSNFKKYNMKSQIKSKTTGSIPSIEEKFMN